MSERVRIVTGHFCSEASMSPAISTWLERRGLCVYTEISVFHRFVDFVAIDDEIIVTVEAKLRLCRHAVWQAAVNQTFASESWVAVSKTPRRSHYIAACQKYGIGLYAVLPDEIVLSPRAGYFEVNPRMAQRCRKLLARSEPGGIGGLESGGDAPAQEVARAVAPHRAAGKSWQWIFSHVSNHYVNYRSLAGVMMSYRPARAILDSYNTGD